MSDRFTGFNGSTYEQLTLPQEFFGAYFTQVDNTAELKILLFCFWALPQKETRFKYLRYADFANNAMLMDGLAALDQTRRPVDTLDEGLASAIKHGALLQAEVQITNQTEQLYLVNSPAGRYAISQLKRGEWQPGDTDNPVEILPPRPNIFTLYESNIGPLTPLIVDDLKDLTQTYSEEWLQDAIHIAVKQGVRSLRYVEAILERWQREGKSDYETGGRSHKRDEGDDYLSGKYKDLLSH